MTAAGLPKLLQQGAIIVTVDQCPVILPPGTPARTASCLVCGQAAGSFSMVAVTLIPTSTGPCDCGRVSCWAFWAHAGCDVSDPDTLVTIAAAVLKCCQERQQQ